MSTETVYCCMLCMCVCTYNQQLLHLGPGPVLSSRDSSSQAGSRPIGSELVRLGAKNNHFQVCFRFSSPNSTYDSRIRNPRCSSTAQGLLVQGFSSDTHIITLEYSSVQRLAVHSTFQDIIIYIALAIESAEQCLLTEYVRRLSNFRLLTGP